jgi:ubiquinone/menaquinone biosynthesis C-methylase UbiE
MTDRKRARQLAQAYIGRGDPTGWFEALYTAARGDPSQISWADMAANPNLVEWLDRPRMDGRRRAISVGCGLGDDAEELARRGLDVVAFDISETAIRWCQDRFPGSVVTYIVADLFDPPKSWGESFDLVLEAYTLQVLPPELRSEAIERIAGLTAPGGTLLVICRGREASDDAGRMPWPVTREELRRFHDWGMQEISFEDYFDQETPPVRRFRVEYKKV